MNLSKIKVVESLGQERYEWLRAHVAPTVQTHLRVGKRSKCKNKAPKSKATWIGEPADDWE